MKFVSLIALFTFSSLSFAEISRVTELKSKIVTVAEKYQGKGDPDFKIQNELEPLVQELQTLTSPEPIAKRLPLLYGTWKQVWGPYEYRKKDRSVDPSLEVKEIYQVVSKDGYYYNVSPNYKNGDKSKVRIDYLKGLYELSETDLNGLDVKFDKYLAIKGRPANGNIYDYILDAERNDLPNQTKVLPSIFVKLFFGGGTLQEIYTDKDIRILYGSNDTVFKNKYLYVMTRVK